MRNLVVVLHIYGSSLTESGEPERQIFQVEGEQGSDWLPFKQVVTVSNNWAIVVEHRTIKTPLFMGDVAIDDVTITQVPGTITSFVKLV